MSFTATENRGRIEGWPKGQMKFWRNLVCGACKILRLSWLYGSVTQERCGLEGTLGVMDIYS